MSKVFRLHEGTDGTGWFSSKIFNDEDLKTILTDGKEVSNSIPSPFARIDLVKEAFRWVAINGIEGNTAQHQLVSDALDIGQLIFYSDKFQQNIDIIEYKPEIRIHESFGSLTSEHQELASTLRVFWDEDADIYNFGDANRIYFVLYNSQLIGATSPASLFFSAPIDERMRSEIDLQRTSGFYLNKNPVSLSDREWDFIEFLFLLSKQRLFADQFPEVYEYLDRVKSELDPDRRAAINNLDADNISDFEQCHVSGEPTNYCQVVGIPLLKAKEKVEDIEKDSDFVIESDFPVEGKRPLILPNSPFSKEWIYTTKDVKWNPDEYNGKIPDKNDKPLDQSKLPIQGNNYPWLSAENFLAEKIIELPYDIDSDKFVTGKGKGSKKYLLPLKETFFKYFDVDNVSEMLELQEMSQGTVVAKLNIKTRGGVVKFEKNYKKTEKVELQVHLAILPFIEVRDDNIPINYTIGVLDSDVTENYNTNYDISCYKDGKLISIGDKVIRSQGKPRVKTFYQQTNKYFDAVRVGYKGTIYGFIVPKMNKYNPGNESCQFAIDFGTTNTHIEYQKGSEVERSFKIDSSQPFWGSLFDRNSDYDRLYLTYEEQFERELIPYSIGDGKHEVNFPLRTALVENVNNKANEGELDIFQDANNYLLYEQKEEGEDLILNTNLKWEDLHSLSNLNRLYAYIEYLITLVYYKSLYLNIDPSNTQITWFYPVSMSRYHRGRLTEAWSKKIKKVYGDKYDESRLKKIPESIGPYYYYHKKKGLTGLTVLIDIGGGSSDVSIYDEGNVKSITSFRFAGDAIFGDGYADDPNENGFVNLFKEDAFDSLEGSGEKTAILEKILGKRGSSKDFSNYLFAYSNNSTSFDYPTLIKNDKNIKLVILLFHAAIAYYIGKLLKGQEIVNPKNLLFSGSGAKTVNILDSSENLNQISELYSFFFEKINGESNSQDMRTEISPIPKELTSKGGLMSKNIDEKDYDTIFWLGGDEDLDKNIDLNNLQESPKVKKVHDDDIEKIEPEIESLYKLLDELNSKINFKKSFGISREAYQLFKKNRGKKIIDEAKMGMRQTIEEQHSTESEPIEESLFFYPLVGEMSRLAFKLSKLSNK